MLPVLVEAIKEKRLGLKAVHDFLPQARRVLEQRQSHEESRRNLAQKASVGRRERLSVSRYFDLGRRSYQAHQLALDALETYKSTENRSYLDSALQQYETASRFEQARLKTRLNFAPVLCERFAKAC